MWADDEYWLPHVLGPEKNDVLGAFVFENKSIMASYKINVLPSLSFSSSRERFFSFIYFIIFYNKFQSM